MEPKSPTYEKLVDTDKPPKSPNRPFRLRFHRMLSGGNLKINSSPNSPNSKSFDSSYESLECIRRFDG